MRLKQFLFIEVAYLVTYWQNIHIKHGIHKQPIYEPNGKLRTKSLFGEGGKHKKTWRAIAAWRTENEVIESPEDETTDKTSLKPETGKEK